MRMNGSTTRLSRWWLKIGLALALGLSLSSQVLAGAPDGFADGTIPIALAADDITAGSGTTSAVRTFTLAESLGIDGMLDDTLLVAQSSNGLLHCLSADAVEAPGQFVTAAGGTVAIVGICRAEAGEWTIAGVDAVSGDHYLLKGEVGVARDGTIAFTGIAYRKLANAEPQSLGRFRLSAKGDF